MTEKWTTRPATPADLEPLVDIRAIVMRPDLERLGRYDEHRVRQRLRDAYDPAHTRVIEVDGEIAGCVALRPASDGDWLEHFYLVPGLHGRGIGGGVLTETLARTDRTVHLNVLQGSPARRLYERHGFVLDHEDAVDVYLTRRVPAS
ncbi:GNAT family N-acetyltransferase [Streptomyces roseirectus]|uniref:GNAT family N-acetyltransferase n=1 Tax=Streptomyces roseirectus TaxID=2768066 RepID=A0A7H0IF02_9ACTN|nr:GNAT family N-acetyltransferase [Streptomyces roseirectus]QNP71368.1 GNAT family N-acetyltransferase [Streptomyces roseirectus]